MPEIIHLEQTHSTNNYLRNLVEAIRIPEEGTVVWADFQTAGRGQQGNSWESAPGENLLFTLLLCPQSIKARNQFIVSQLVSLGILKTLNQLKEGFRVKWPNDIYYHNKKVAGILIENDLSGQTLYNSFIGIGLNVNQKEFTSDAPNPVSLYQILGAETDRTFLLDQILRNILYYYEIALEGNYTLIRDKYMQQLFRNDGYHPFSDAGRHFLARIKHIYPTGHLILEDESGIEQTYDFKEVEFVL